MSTFGEFFVNPILGMRGAIKLCAVPRFDVQTTSNLWTALDT